MAEVRDKDQRDFRLKNSAKSSVPANLNFNKIKVGRETLKNDVTADLDYWYKRSNKIDRKKVEKAIKNGGGSLLTDIEIFDVYTGVGIGLDKKSMAYSLTFSDNKKTLTDDEVNALMNKIIDTVSKKCGAELRK